MVNYIHCYEIRMGDLPMWLEEALYTECIGGENASSRL